MNYDKLSEEIKKCTKCALCATRTNVVVDRGDPTAKLMFIGEAPGASEDALGQAFVGRSGALLDEYLKEVGIDKFIVVNVIKCRPPNNKFPGDQGAYHPEDVVSFCLPWLDKQIEAIQPKAIVLVGGKSATYTIYRGRPTPPVRDIVGKRFRTENYPGIDIFGMYHPSYLLRLRNSDPQGYDQIRRDTFEILADAQAAADDLAVGIPITHLSRKPEKGEQLRMF